MIRQSAGQLIRGHIAPEDLHPDLELAHVLPTPHPIEHGLKFVGRREGSVKVIVELVPIRQALVKITADEPFE